ncbi:MAG: Hsp33 family molecular chaperone HslO [Pseudomonadota bacterium]
MSEGATNPGAEDAPLGDDSVLPFQLDALDLRGRVARLDRTLDRILTQHRYPPSVCALLGEATLLAAMIGQAMKLRYKFSIQAKGEGPVSLIAADYRPGEGGVGPAEMRAYAQFDPEATPETMDDPYSLLGEGLFAMTIDQGPRMTPYQGLTPLVAGGLTACAETYFAQSEQIATRFTTAIGQAAEPGGARRWRAGGVMLQHLAEFGESAQAEAEKRGPSGEDGLMTAQDVADLGDQSEAWNRANILLDTAEEIELIGPHVTPERLLVRLFHEETPRVYPAQAITFGCSCSREKVSDLLSKYPENAVREMTTEDGDITADCQFCGAQYRFALDEVIAV